MLFIHFQFFAQQLPHISYKTLKPSSYAHGDDNNLVRCVTTNLLKNDCV